MQQVPPRKTWRGGPGRDCQGTRAKIALNQGRGQWRTWEGAVGSGRAGLQVGGGGLETLEGPWNVHLAFRAGADLGGGNCRALPCMGMFSAWEAAAHRARRLARRVTRVPLRQRSLSPAAVPARARSRTGSTRTSNPNLSPELYRQGPDLEQRAEAFPMSLPLPPPPPAPPACPWHSPAGSSGR